MLSVEFKRGFIMIKICNLPQICIMTSQAIRTAVIFKLPVMIILMAA